MQEIIIATISSALLSSVVTALISPHVNWNIEKKKIRIENQRKFIENIRSEISKQNFERDSFRKTELYSRIYPFLSLKLKSDIDSTAIKIIRSREGGFGGINNNDILRRQISIELSELEKKWGLL